METLSEAEQVALVYDDAHRNATALQHTQGDVEAAMALLCKGRP